MKTKIIQLMRTSFAKGAAFALGIFATGVVAVTITGTIHTFSAGDVLSSSQINENFQTLRTAIESISVTGDGIPIGTILAWHKSMSGTPALPAGWVECNGQTISDADSPYNGQTIPNLNGDPGGANSPDLSGKYSMFLRGGTTSGTGQMDAFQGHRHSTSPSDGVIRRAAGGSYDYGAGSYDNQGLQVMDPIADPSNGTPRTASETRPVNMSVVWIMKIK